MRISVVDPYYRMDSEGTLAVFYDIYLNGVKVVSALEADTDEGWALCYEETLEEFIASIGESPEDREHKLPVFMFGKVEVKKDERAPKTPRIFD